MYLKRTLEKTITSVSNFFPVVLITGPRQVGKTTVFEMCEKETRNKVSLDSFEIRQLAQSDPRAFLDRYPAPLLIDEIQYAPQLFSYIKEIVDREKKTGMYWLTGSQQFHLMKNVTESLAGRVGILKLQGLSADEKAKRPDVTPFLPTKEFIQEKRKNHSLSTSTLYHLIWKGSYPALFTKGDENWGIFYDSYIQTYVERDVKQITQISDELLFINFIRVLASLTGRLINYTSIAKDIGVSVNTIKSWLSILQTSGLIYLLHPYHNNLTKRVIKTPKVYFMDTGLACYLTKWNTPETLEAGAMDGAMLETYVVSEIIKSYWHNGKEPNIYFYRDNDQKEIDVVLEENGILYPIEIKKKTNPNKSDIASFSILKNFGKKVGEGAVICTASTDLPITENVNVIPVGYI